MGQHVTLNTSRIELSDSEKALLDAVQNNQKILLQVSSQSPLANVFQTVCKTNQGVPKTVHAHEVKSMDDCLRAANLIVLNGRIEALEKTHIGPKYYSRSLLKGLLAPDDPAFKYQMRMGLLASLARSAACQINPNNDGGVITSHPRLFFFRAAYPGSLGSVPYTTGRVGTPSIQDILDIAGDSNIDPSNISGEFAVLAKPYARPNDSNGEIHWKVSSSLQMSPYLGDKIGGLLTPNGSRLVA